MMIKKPDRLNIDKNDRKLYDEIRIFKKKENKEKFLFAMAYGYMNNIRFPIKSKDGFILNKTLLPEDEALINSLAVKDSESPEILLDLQDVYNIAEEYAHAGLKMLYDESMSNAEHGSFNIKLEKEIFEKIKKIENI
ncbi:MAG: hypothetical protein K8S14_09870 [Actinomycetia bacterium]|nr:hypothetical protein [Actinomycetes bacterium]